MSGWVSRCEWSRARDPSSGGSGAHIRLADTDRSVRAGEGNRTPVSSLGSLRSAIEPHPRGPTVRRRRALSVATCAGPVASTYLAVALPTYDRPGSVAERPHGAVAPAGARRRDGLGGDDRDDGGRRHRSADRRVLA